MSPSGSASSIFSDSVSGYHVLTIRDYFHSKAIPTGEWMSSHPFTVGGYRWRIYYYPNGSSPQVADYVSVSLELQLEEVGATAVNAQFEICLTGEEEEAESLASASVHEFTSKKCWQYPQFIKREDLENSKHLKNNSFAIRCDIVVIHGHRTVDDMAAFVSAPAPPCDVCSKLLETNKGADVVFEVGSETVTAHRCVLATCSTVLAAELFGPMKEGNTAAPGIVRVKDMEMEVLKALINFAYTRRLPERANEDDDVMCQHLLVAADRYGMEQLKLMCEKWLCEHIDVGTAATILALAEQHRCERLKKACFDFLAAPVKLRRSWPPTASSI